ncbi:MAG: hypothetical protein HY314_02485 [Acidobacteria bacterium]|nr:hypothetical protein [Acidobacteriota bacterium]
MNAIQFAAGTGSNAGKLVPRTDFGTPTQALDPGVGTRVIQLAAKFVF